MHLNLVFCLTFGHQRDADSLISTFQHFIRLYVYAPYTVYVTTIMKILIYSIWLILSLTMLCRVGYGQESSNNPPQQLKQQIRWLERRGFPARDYQWGDPEVNQYLQQALKANEQANGRLLGGYGLVGIGSVTASVGLVGLFFASLEGILASPDAAAEKARYGIITGVGLGALVGGVVASANGRKKKREAERHVLSALRRRDVQP